MSAADYDPDADADFDTIRAVDDDDLFSRDIGDVLDSLRGDYTRVRRSVRERSAEPSRRERTGAIAVSSVDFQAASNATKHYTDKFELTNAIKPNPVFRRGIPFSLIVHFQREYNPERDLVVLFIYTGRRPKKADGSLVALTVTKNTKFSKSRSNEWDILLDSHEGDNLRLQVQIPTNTGIGTWRAVVKTADRKRTRRGRKYECEENIYILFNPWDKDDEVYMEDEKLRQEYVLNDVGKIFNGTHSSPSPRPWVYGQFEDIVLPACMYLLQLARLNYKDRARVLSVARVISATVNYQNEGGVIVGAWKDFSGGTEPWKWTGSVPILEEYMKTNGTPVRYGQCWVFGGVTTTVCRALGIPCRCVTNFSSAHDTDGSMTIDKYFNKEGEDITEEVVGEYPDSVWNYHVWNEVWMIRPDLPPGYGGWQVIDATPQEPSAGRFQLGPCSVLAVRRGEVGYRYDAPFVFCEVNGDMVHWVPNTTSSKPKWKRSFTRKYYVGRSILTQGISKRTIAERLTDNYKDREGSIEERMAVRNAIRNGPLSELYGIPKKGSEDVELDLMDTATVMIGQPIVLQIKVSNKSTERRRVSVRISASTVYYTGIVAANIKGRTATYKMEPNKGNVLQMTITPEQYLDKLVDYSMIKVYAAGTVNETEQVWSEEDDFRLEKPKLHLEADGSLKVGEEFTLKMSFTNPLNIKLTRCILKLEGPGIVAPYSVNVSDVGPNKNFSHEEKLKPYRGGWSTMVVIFDSLQLNEIIGSERLRIQN